MRLSSPAVLALAAAACSGAPADQPARAAALPTPAPAAVPAPRTPSGLATGRAAPEPGEMRTFGDWTVACDNVLICTMASLGSNGGEPPAATLALTRQPGPHGGWEVAIGTPGADAAPPPVAVMVDRHRIALDRLDGPPAATLARAMVNGRALSLNRAGSTAQPRVSLTGASAALRWIDAQQGRAGTVTAAVATGPRPATAVPARRSPPIVEALTPSGTAVAPTDAQLAAMRQRAGCDDTIIRAGLQPENHTLGGGATLVLLPCSTGAYNLSSALFVIRGGEVAAARVDAPTGFGPTPAAGTDRLASVVNGAWKDGELTSLAKGRGLGDCGVAQTLVWDGASFRLSAQSAMGECRGNPDFITTWRTKVMRR